MKFFSRYFLNPLIALVLIALIEAATRYLPGYTPSLMLPFAALFISSFLFVFGYDTGGLWSQIVVATIITSYAVASDSFDGWRAAQIAFAAYLGALASGYRIRRYRLARSMIQDRAETIVPTNGNRQSMSNIREYMFNIERAWDALSDEAKRKAWQDAISDITDLELKAVIWHQMARDRGFVEQPESVAIKESL